jgi:hypothetical protein
MYGLEGEKGRNNIKALYITTYQIKNLENEKKACI